MRVANARAGSAYLAARPPAAVAAAVGQQLRPRAAPSTASAQQPRIDEIDDDGVFAIAVARGCVARHEATIEALLGPARASLFSWRAFLAAADPPTEGAPREPRRVDAAREAAALQAELGCALDRAAALDAGAGDSSGGEEAARGGGVGEGARHGGALDDAPPGLAVQGRVEGSRTSAEDEDQSANLEEFASTLAMMGFDEEASWNALALSGGDLEAALAALLAEDSEGDDGVAGAESEGVDTPVDACEAASSLGVRTAIASDGVPAEWIGTELPPYCCVVLHAHEDRTRFLFEHRGDCAAVARGELTCFGGKRERNERPLDCVVRECREELSWSPGVDELRANGVARLIVDGALVAWFFRAQAPPSSAALAFEQGRSAVWASLTDARLSRWHWSVLRAMARGETTAHFASSTAAAAAATAALLRERATLHRDAAGAAIGAAAGAALAPPSSLLERALVACPALRDELEIAEYVCDTVITLVEGDGAEGDGDGDGDGDGADAARDALCALLADAGLKESEQVAHELVMSAVAAHVARRAAVTRHTPPRAVATLTTLPSLTAAPHCSDGATPDDRTAASDAIAPLIAMGFQQYDAERALNRTGGDAAAAVAWLLGG